jgi:hypothetical protein
MPYLFQDDFEGGNFSKWDYVWDNHSGLGVTIATSPVHGGTKSAQMYYEKAAGLGDDDEGLQTLTVNGLTHIFARGYVYLKTPEVGGNKNDIQRKLIYSHVESQWQFFLTSECAGGVITPRMASSLESAYSSITMGWDTWYRIQVEVGLNTPGVADGIARLWIDGAPAVESTTFQWRPSGATGNFEELFFGFSADNGSTGPAIKEYRYWDDVVISTAYIGP